MQLLPLPLAILKHQLYLMHHSPALLPSLHLPTLKGSLYLMHHSSALRSPLHLPTPKDLRFPLHHSPTATLLQRLAENQLVKHPCHLLSSPSVPLLPPSTHTWKSNCGSQMLNWHNSRWTKWKQTKCETSTNHA